MGAGTQMEARPAAERRAGPIILVCKAGGMICFGAGDPLYERYHDEEWGRPVKDERGLYEKLCLEAFQSGLAWITILRKRDAFRRAFAAFDPDAAARSGKRDTNRLRNGAGTVRNRLTADAA